MKLTERHKEILPVSKDPRNMNVDDIMIIIDKATEPKAMSKAAALDFLEEIEAAIEYRKEALHDEIENEATS